VARYRVYRGGAQIASVPGSTLKYSDTGVVNGTSYSYTVKAVDAAGNVSAASNTATVTSQPASNTATVTSQPASGTATATPSPPQTTLPNCSQQPFCGDYETGNLTQWAFQPMEGNSSITIGAAATQPVKQGIYSAKFVTYPGTGTVRAELNATQADTGGYPGQEWYYGWWTYFPSTNGQPQQWWSAGGDWNDIAQFQSVDWTAWMYLGVDQGNYTPGTTSIFLNWGSRGHFVVANPLQYDHWYHFVLHAKWSIDPSVGFIELDVDGAQAIPRTYGATLYNTTVARNPGWTAPGAYAELDLYTRAGTYTNTVIHDGLCRAASHAAAAGC
jgi:polysaccharide lyase-like protein